MTAKRYCTVGLVLYAGLSLTDFALTYVIIRTEVGYESNPVAEAWLHRHGWAGLAAFKTLSALVFGGTIAVLARHRPRTAAVLVTLGCAALLWVVLYSREMLERHERTHPHPPLAEAR